MWKNNWEETKRHFVDWWNREGLVLGGSPLVEEAPRERVTAPTVAPTLRDHYADAERRAARNHQRLAQHSYPADVLPICTTDIGPGSLALFLVLSLASPRKPFGSSPVYNSVNARKSCLSFVLTKPMNGGRLPKRW